jgi:hypothetical protein
MTKKATAARNGRQAASDMNVIEGPPVVNVGLRRRKSRFMRGPQPDDPAVKHFRSPKAKQVLRGGPLLVS